MCRLFALHPAGFGLYLFRRIMEIGGVRVSLHFSELAVYWRKLVLMEPMQFWTKLVKTQHAIRLRLSEVGGTLMFVSFCLIGVLDRLGKSGNQDRRPGFCHG